ncbi:DUF2306 domain-containing protein [Flavobacterium salilacus subsp. salilacus]|uniref:DUF2306 domain-containing protein n=1 Tax=Flavobacterium TaxID=237 RepID=UPI001074F6C6|nr:MULTISPECIES: DUF2306 domain-containing protein [Flavobacterium]KAF2519689.1 DUF2306 domain-containing protein [Flavobacterium salilacus subsp. salilacus]MBE1614423.1 DUF2306 domain-containing protein [Flavobacterium sp. SaA2.13]
MKNNTNSNKLKLDKTDIVPVLIWITILFLTWLFMHGADHFLKLTPEALGKYFNLKWFLIAHITAGGGALVLGLVQFWRKLRNYSWKLHRIIGFLYLLAILVSSTCAVILAFTTAYEVNRTYAFSLQIWVSVWISAAFIAYYAAIKKKFKLHEEWMVRSYIVTLAFIISGLSLKLKFIQDLGSFEDISPSLFWMGWAVPLYIYQVILSAKQKR